MSTEAEPPKLAPDVPSGLKLDFGCGTRCREGFEGVDVREGCGVHRVDLFRFPFPWGDSAVAEINACHFVEHLPAREVEEREALGTRYVGMDYFLAFFDECYRVLAPGGKMSIDVPCARADRAFQDPTHRRFLNEGTFSYLNAKCRADMALEHYPSLCDFDFVCIPVGMTEFALYTDEVRAARFRNHWNAVLDLKVNLTSRKR